MINTGEKLFPQQKIVKVNQIVTVKVISVDVNKKRIGLSIKQV